MHHHYHSAAMYKHSGTQTRQSSSGNSKTFVSCVNASFVGYCSSQNKGNLCTYYFSERHMKNRIIFARNRKQKVRARESALIRCNKIANNVYGSPSVLSIHDDEKLYARLFLFHRNNTCTSFFHSVPNLIRARI